MFLGNDGEEHNKQVEQRGAVTADIYFFTLNNVMHKNVRRVKLI
jgi:hypothetical protein